MRYLFFCRKATWARDFDKNFFVRFFGIIALLFSSANAYTQPCVTPPAGLVNWWQAEGNASDTAGTNSGVLNGGVTFGPGKVGQAFNLNGSNQFVNVGNLTPTGSFTIEGWINPRRDQANVIMAKWGTSGSYINLRSYIFLMHQNLGLRFAVTDVANINNGSLHAFDTPDNVLAINAWNHVAAVYNRSTGTRQIYVNGVKVAERTDPPMVVNNTSVNVTIGARLASSTQSSEWFDGLIDDLSFYSQSLTGDQIQSLYAAGSDGKCLGTFGPLITAQPQDQSVIANGNATFTLSVSGTSPLTYQWKFNDADIVGATNSSFTVTNAQPANAGLYRVAITNLYGSVISSNANLTVNGLAPAISSGPQSLTVNAGSNANFSVTVSGTTPFTYQWFLNGGSLPGETRSSLTITNAQSGNAGSYAVAVTNAFGSVMSSNAVLTVNVFPPVITNQPQNRTVNAGASTNFTVGATGTPTLKYQWLFNGVPINLATNTILNIANAQPANEGIYRVVVTNAYGSATSSVATLTVNVFPPMITTQPQSRVANAGASVTFTTAATGTAPLGYQWQFNAVNIAGATNTSFALNNVQLTNSGNYTVVVTNPYGTATSSNASLVVNVFPPSIITHPQSQIVKVGNTANVSVIADGTAPLSYQWLFNDVEITSATNSSLSIINFSTNNTGNYSVVITNAFGAVLSSNALLTAYFPACTSAPSNLVSWWTGDATAADFLGLNNGVTNGVSYSTGKVGAAFDFNGLNSYVDVGSGTSLSSPASFAIEGWIYPRQDQNNVIFSKWGNAGIEKCYIFLMHQNLGLRFAVTDQANVGNAGLHAFDTPNNVLTTNAWNHVAAVYDQLTGTRRIYVNGLKVAERIDPPMIVNNTPFRVTIGARRATDTAFSEHFIGAIDEMSFYSRALDGNEIQAIYAADNFGKCKAGVIPYITSQPQPQNVNAGANASFSVSAAGNLPLAFQWLLNGATLASATNSTLVIINAQPANAGNYSVVVTNAYGAVTSSIVTLTVNTFPPAITTQPQNQTVNAGATANFSVTATGTAPLAYQWFFNGVTLGAATNSALAIANAQPANAGIYRVIVTNAYGSATSSIVTLAVNTFPPAITTQPQNQTVNAGATANFSVTATGTAPLAYQWFFNGVTLGAATSSSLIVSNAQPTNAGIYRVVVTNAYGSATSSIVTLAVNTFPPAITTQPQNQTVNAGATANFSVTATGTAPLAYQWFFNGVTLGAATSSSLIVSNAQPTNAGIYRVVVTNAYGSVTSSNAVLELFIPTCVSAPSNLISWWAAEGSAIDSKGTNHGTLVGGVTFAAGKVGRAFDFYGPDRYIDVGTNMSLNPTGSFTIEGWIFPRNDQPNVILGKWGEYGSYEGQKSFIFLLQPGRRLRFAITDQANIDNSDFHSFDTPFNVLTTNAWNHVAAVYNQPAGTRQIYVNGLMVAERVDSPINMLTASVPLTIGARLVSDNTSSEPFNGMIDELSIYSSALSVQEIHAIYRADNTGKCPSPVALKIVPSATSTNVTLTWPATAVGSSLEEVAGFGNSIWSPVVASPVTNGAEISVTLPRYGSNRFYRLRRP